MGGDGSGEGGEIRGLSNEARLSGALGTATAAPPAITLAEAVERYSRID